MKQLSKTSFSETVSGVKLFREDIEDILFRLKNQSFNIEIQNSNSVYDDLDEVVKLLGSNPQNLTISAERQSNLTERVIISIEKSNVRIYSSGSEVMYSFGFELKDYFKSKVAFYHNKFKPLLLLYFISILPAVGFFNINTARHPYPWMMYLNIVIAFFLIIAAFIYLYFGGLILSRKHEYGFWNRNKDKIILLIIGSAIGSAMTLFVQSFKN